MIIDAFGLGMTLQLGDFDAGWIGLMSYVTPISWRVPGQQVRPHWQGVPVAHPEWEEV